MVLSKDNTCKGLCTGYRKRLTVVQRISRVMKFLPLNAAGNTALVVLYKENIYNIYMYIVVYRIWKVSSSCGEDAQHSNDPSHLLPHLPPHYNIQTTL